MPSLTCLAVNKPAGVITAPKHRYTGGSMVRGHLHPQQRHNAAGCRQCQTPLLPTHCSPRSNLLSASPHKQVNRVIGTLGFEPLTLHRLDMNTTGALCMLLGRCTCWRVTVPSALRLAGARLCPTAP